MKKPFLPWLCCSLLLSIPGCSGRWCSFVCLFSSCCRCCVSSVCRPPVDCEESLLLLRRSESWSPAVATGGKHTQPRHCLGTAGISMEMPPQPPAAKIDLASAASASLLLLLLLPPPTPLLAAPPAANVLEDYLR